MVPATRPAEAGVEPLSETIERYLEAIFYIDGEGEVVRAARLADWLSVSPPTVASALQRMAKSGLIESNGAKEVVLTPRGRELASGIVRRHRIAERMVGGEEIHILERRRLVEDLMRIKLGDRPDDGHDDTLPSPRGIACHVVLSIIGPSGKRCRHAVREEPDRRGCNPGCIGACSGVDTDGHGPRCQVGRPV